MAKFWWMALALLVSAGLWAAPAMAKSTESGDNLGSIQRGGAEGSADTTLGQKGLAFTSDGFQFKLQTYVQFRLTYQNEVANGRHGQNGADFINFRVRRLKPKFSGYIFQKEFQYQVVLSLTDGGNKIVEEAWFRWAVLQYVNITAGQTHTQWNWEEVVSASSQEFTERSLVNEVFNQDFAKGLTIDGQVGDDVPWLKYWVGVYNGVLKGNNDFRNSDSAINSDSFSNLVDNEMMVNLRLETHPLGEVSHGMNDMRSEEEYGKVIFAVGLAVNWFTSGYNAAAAGIRDDLVGGTTASGRLRTSQDTLAFTIDGHFRWHGLSADLAYYWRHTEFHNRGANKFSPNHQADVGNLEDTAFTVDISYFILPQQFNVGIRYGMLNAEDFWQGGSGANTPRAFGVRPDTTEIGLAVNYYVQGDNLKLTLDITWVGQQLAFAAGGGGGSMLGVYNTPPGRVAGGGTIGSSEADHNDLWIIRLQIQWKF
jgi:hypothetical protein